MGGKFRVNFFLDFCRTIQEPSKMVLFLLKAFCTFRDIGPFFFGPNIWIVDNLQISQKFQMAAATLS